MGRYFIEQIADIIASGHAFTKHVEGQTPLRDRQGNILRNNGVPVIEDVTPKTGSGITNEFRDTELGADLYIDTREDMAAYIKGMLRDPGTKGVHLGGLNYIFYNHADSTFLKIDGASQDFGTLYRDKDIHTHFKSQKSRFRKGKLQPHDHSESPEQTEKILSRMFKNELNPGSQKFMRHTAARIDEAVRMGITTKQTETKDNSSLKKAFASVTAAEQGAEHLRTHEKPPVPVTAVSQASATNLN
jgi:hypothetical protein